MQKHVLVLTTSAFILAWGASAASAQQVPMTQQQPQILQQQQTQERQLQGAQTPRRSIEDDFEEAGWAGVMALVGGTTRTGSRSHGSRHDAARRFDGSRKYGSRHDDADDVQLDGQ
jgi:opacity protein-like surface antigen